MEHANQAVGRRTFLWPSEARELVRTHLSRERLREATPGEHTELKALIARLAAVSGNPRGACWRFARRLGLKSKPSSRPWTRLEQQRLLELIASHSLAEVTLLLRRSSGSVRSMLHRLGANARMGQDWFTRQALAEALHIRADQVQKWIDRGWLRCRVVGRDGLTRQLIDAAEFCDFCKRHRKEVVGNRLNVDRLNFVQTCISSESRRTAARQKRKKGAGGLRRTNEGRSGKGRTRGQGTTSYGIGGTIHRFTIYRSTARRSIPAPV